MLGSLIFYLKGMRIMMFQLFGFCLYVLKPHQDRGLSEDEVRAYLLHRVTPQRPLYRGLWFRVVREASGLGVLGL